MPAGDAAPPGDAADLPDISDLRGRDRRRAAGVLAVFSRDDEPLADGIDMTLFDAAGAPVGRSSFRFVEPHTPALSEVMSDVEDHLLGAARLVVHPASYALVQRGRALRARVSLAPKPGARDALDV
ncbi:hypothetical protein AX769_12460 [Frondihabitans sp. PAMC 28766]|nr:hypothetical protein AX769_12460 [Frondihabitans sp. PAMC 28766]